MERLKIVATKSGDKKILFESENAESIINWLITILYDAHIKRAKVKSTKYYGKDGKDYVKIIGYYEDTLEPGGKLIYTITGVRNDWGNFINVQKTLLDNKIEIIKGE